MIYKIVFFEFLFIVELEWSTPNMKNWCLNPQTSSGQKSVHAKIQSEPFLCQIHPLLISSSRHMISIETQNCLCEKLAFSFFQHKSLSVSAFERNKSVMFACVCNVWVSCPGHVGFVVSGLTWLHSKYLGLPFANFGARCPLKFHSRIDGLCLRVFLEFVSRPVGSFVWRANDYCLLFNMCRGVFKLFQGVLGSMWKITLLI